MEDILGIGKATEALSKEFANLISPLLRPGAEVGGQIIVDRMSYWRLRQAMSLVEKTINLLKSKNIQPRSVPPKILAAVLNQGSLEEDVALTEKWAGLLASAAAGDAVHPSYPSILEQLSPDEARMLDAMYQRLVENRPNRHKSFFAIRELYQKTGIQAELFIIYLDNLRRLELCQAPSNIDLSLLSSEVFGLQIMLSALGENFVVACRGPSSTNHPN